MLLLSPWAKATELTSNDPYWIGNDTRFGTTEGNDFWLTFMNNAMFNPETTPDVLFELKIAVSARQQTHVFFEVGGTVVHDHVVGAEETYIYDISLLYSQIYLQESEVANIYKGVHVYTDNKDNLFSCFCYNRNGEAGSSSRDITLVNPTEYLGKEYYIQTSPYDIKSSEFAVVATEDNTMVTVYPSNETYAGKPQNIGFTVVLDKGDAYLVASKQQTGDDFNVDLSGSRVCADKPVAVFNGNQQTSHPIDEAYSTDFTVEQVIPIKQWGTDFYLSILANTTENNFRITAAFDGTDISIRTYDKDADANTDEFFTLDAGMSLDPYILDKEFSTETVIHSSKPILLYDYTTSAAMNQMTVGSGANRMRVSLGDPSSAMMPSWTHKVTSMNFFTTELDPQLLNNKKPPQFFFVYIVTPTSNTQNITVDGTSYASSFSAFQGEPAMSYAHIPLDQDTHYHTVESSGDGFVGMVYGMTHAQGYFYTLGYTPDPFRDTLFVANTENIMSPLSYDVQPRLDRGWYQRQWKEWKEDHERLDTAQVCDGETVQWLLQSPLAKQTDPVDWYIYDVTDTEKTIFKEYSNLEESRTDASYDEEVSGNRIFRWAHTFTLPDESDLPPEERIPFKEYEIQAVLHHGHQICTDLPADLDTLRTVVRVSRTYHDTIYKIICMGDTLKCFYDSLPHQNAQGDPKELEDRPDLRTATADSTLFIGDKTDGDNMNDFQWKARAGQNEFTRKYETIYGCDSTYTLFLFVCDTFRIKDTIHLCKNEVVTYLEDNPQHKKTYKGIEYEGAGYTIATDTVDTILMKTKFCECQLAPYADKYPAFEGCDSVYELHIFMHEVYRDTLVDTMCYNRNPDSVYIWPIQKGTDELHITKSHPKMIYDAGLRARIGFFSDTLRTSSCPDCNNGTGCDSISVLKLIIPEPFYDYDTIELCSWVFNETTHQRDSNVYRWEHHRNNAAYVDLPESGDYSDSCLTRFGCDSIYYLHLAYTPQFWKDESYMMANNKTYTWQGTTYGPYPEIKKDSTMHFYAQYSHNGCDSVFHLALRISDTYLFPSERAICDIDSVHWRDTIIVGAKWQGTGEYDIRLTTDRTTHIYDSLLTVALPIRDSIYLLTVTQYPTYEKTLALVPLCQGQTEYDWIREDNGELIQHIVFPTIINYPFDTMLTDTLPTRTPTACDSILHLPLRIYPAYDTPMEKDTICESDPDWSWHISDSYGNYTVEVPLRDLQQQVFDTTMYYTLHTAAASQCDSLVSLHRVIKPILRHTETLVLCSEMVPYTYGEHGKQATEDGLYYDTVPSIQYGCDSVTTYDITIREKIITELTVDMCDNEAPYVHPTEHRPNYLENLTTTGTYYDTISSHISGCDSIIELHLNVWETYEHDQFDTICDNGSFNFHGHIFENLPAQDTPHRFDSILTSVHGCDSLIHLYLTVHPTFDIPAVEDTICETATDWSWHISDTYGNYTVEVPIRDLQQQLFDTLLTYTLHSAVSTHCDSVVRMHRVVKPILRRTIHPVICPEKLPYQSDPMGKEAYETSIYNDTLVSTLYGCDSILTVDLTVLDKIITPLVVERCDNELPYNHPTENTRLMNLDTTGIYYDTIVSHITGCDSILVLDFKVWKTYDTLSLFTICSRDTFIWEQKDINGTYRPLIWAGRIDTVVLTVDEVLTPQQARNTFTISRDTMLQSIHGCDSMSHMELTVHPTYFFYTDTTICSSDEITYRGQTFPSLQARDTTYTEVLTTADGCDSIYQLHLRIKPMFLYTRYRDICDNETLIFPEDGRVVWQPGDPLPEENDFVDFNYNTREGCDSIYRYYVSVHPTYLDERDMTLCSNERVALHDGLDVSVGIAYDVTQYILPFDTVFIDTLQTHIYGCDSVFRINAHILPQYYHLDEDTICDNGSATWRGRAFSDLTPGIHSYFDSLKTDDGCDSVYEFRIYVNTTHLMVDHITKCADEDLTWRNQNLDHVEPGDHFYYDSLTTIISGCDSVYHLYLTVKDTTAEYRHDTICRTETYDLHGVQLSEAGFYKDTTLNSDQCHHFTYLQLDMIEPTVPTAWTESVCADDQAYELHYRYTGDLDPIAYSLYYDEAGKEMGFEDQIDIAITTEEELSVLTLPMPLRDADKTHYPRPDIYKVRLVLDNGKCVNPDLSTTDTSIVLSYPSWIAEQRFGDVIALCNDRYNGGYTWDAFQWYHGDELMVGETREYLYVPTGLVVGDQYYVRLTRTGEEENFQTCPITITADPIYDDHAPKMGYLSVVPTCIVTGHPYANILSRKDGTYRITSSTGHMVEEGVFRADVTEIELPAVSGIYIIQLWSQDTPEEPYRSIKVIVRDKCENCETSF